MPKMIRINAGNGWQTVTLTDEEVEKVTKENMEYNIQALTNCMKSTTLGVDVAKLIYQSAFAKPLHFALEEYAMLHCDRPSPDQQKFLNDLCKDVGIDVPDVKKSQVSPLIETLKLVRLRGKTKGPMKSSSEKLPPSNIEYVCEGCEGKITSPKVVDYSKEHFEGRLLCYDCQQGEGDL